MESGITEFERIYANRKPLVIELEDVAEMLTEADVRELFGLTERIVSLATDMDGEGR